MKKIADYTLCDTRFIAEYSDYVEFCEINNIEPEEKDSRDYWDFVAEEQTREWEDFCANMKYSKYKDTPVLLTGCLGLWNGRPSIQPIRFENIIDAIEKCANSVDDIKVTVENGVINVYGYHHDGTNCFEIHKLSKKGERVSSNWEREYTYGRGYSNYAYSHSGDVKDYMLAKFHDYLY